MSLFQPGVFQPGGVFQQDEVVGGVTVEIDAVLGPFTSALELRPRRGSGVGRRERPVRIAIYARLDPFRGHIWVEHHDDGLLLEIMEATKETL